MAAFPVTMTRDLRARMSISGASPSSPPAKTNQVLGVSVPRSPGPPGLLLKDPKDTRTPPQARGEAADPQDGLGTLLGGGWHISSLLGTPLAFRELDCRRELPIWKAESG